MVKMKTKSILTGIVFFLFIMNGIGQKTPGDYDILKTNEKGEGVSIEIEFQKGLKHYFPLFAIWVEDMEGNFIHSLYVAESIAKGRFDYGRTKEGEWIPGPKKIPAALPYWGHKRKGKTKDSLFIPTPDNPVIDAYTGATPTSNFILKTKTNKIFADSFRILLEINQSWDWNEHWYNDKYPGNKEYLKSAQPALVYEVVINMKDEKKEYEMKPVGHSHPYGATGELFPDINTLTTALKIADKIVVKIK